MDPNEKLIISKIMAVLFSITLACSSHAQIWIEGQDIYCLKGQKEVEIKFSYEKLKVTDVITAFNYNKIKLLTEQDYLKYKYETYRKKGDSAKGVLWLEHWERNKRQVFEPEFRNFFNKGSKGMFRCDTSVHNSKYTLQVNVLRMDLGESEGTATCDFEMLIFETLNPEEIIARRTAYEVAGLKYEKREVLRSAVVATLLLPAVLLTGGGILNILFGENYLGYHSFSERVADSFANCGNDFGKKISEACRN